MAFRTLITQSMDQSNSPHSDLRQRLERLGVTRGMPGKPKPPPKPETRDQATGIEAVIDGELVNTPLGGCFVTEEARPADDTHGNITLSAIHTHGDGTLAAIAQDDQLHQFDPEAAAFIDIETSGLAGGTGTFAFLVGVGFFDGPTFRVRQFFMRDPSEEPAVIHLLDDLLQNFEAVVSFNGKAFDVPLLDTRFILWRRRFPLKNAPHLDLLAPARRLWKERLSSCSLTSLEEHILGIFREGDVPGWLIPALYFEYEKTGNARPLKPVFTHNALDILSMVSLTAHMARRFVEPETAGVKHGADWYSLGRCYETLGWADQAEGAYRQALSAPCALTIRQRALENLSFLYKRRSMWDRATEIWQDLINAGLTDRLYPYEELAKYYEHQQREHAPAIQLVREAVRRIQERDLWPRRPRHRALSELRHRLARLERKAGRVGQ
ncbi:MAG: ribonuclease H-like domain-containing protein [Anaerolineae bacterium]